MELNFTVETKDVLLDMIKRHNKMYRMGTPEISDAEYDAEIELLKTLDPDNEWFKHTEPAFVPETRKRAFHNSGHVNAEKWSHQKVKKLGGRALLATGERNRREPWPHLPELRLRGSGVPVSIAGQRDRLRPFLPALHFGGLPNAHIRRQAAGVQRVIH